jgi:hypothetical protein
MARRGSARAPGRDTARHMPRQAQQLTRGRAPAAAPLCACAAPQADAAVAAACAKAQCSREALTKLVLDGKVKAGKVKARRARSARSARVTRPPAHKLPPKPL